jgi:DNA-binding CsgD family transcriptional regulator
MMSTHLIGHGSDRLNTFDGRRIDPIPQPLAPREIKARLRWFEMSEKVERIFRCGAFAELLEVARDLCKADAAVLVDINTLDGWVRRLARSHLAPSTADEFAKTLHSMGPRLLRTGAGAGQQVVRLRKQTRTHVLVGMGEADAQDDLVEKAARAGFRSVLLGLYPSGVGRVLGVVLLKANGSAFSPEEEDSLADVLAPVHGATQMIERLRPMQRQTAAAEAFLSALSAPVAVVNETGVIRYANQAALALGAAAALRCSSGRLRLHSAADVDSVGTALRRVIASGPNASETLQLTNRGGRGCKLLIIALAQSDNDPEPLAAIIVLAEQADCDGGGTAELLRRSFDLTEAEAKVTLAIANGQTPADIHASTGQSLPTIRTHLSRAFAKMGLSRQAELAGLVAQYKVFLN